MPRPGRGLLRRLARWNGAGQCILCQHYLAEGHGQKLSRHVERDHVPEDFGLTPMNAGGPRDHHQEAVAGD